MFGGVLFMKKLSMLEEHNNSIEQNLLQAGFIVSRRIAYLNAKSGDWDIARINTIYVDDKNKNVAFVKVYFSGIFKFKKNLTSKVKICSYKDINNFELKKDGETIISGSSGRAFAGGVLAGTTGAIIGGSGKKTAKNKCISADLTIYINDLQDPVFTFNIFDSKYVLRKSKEDEVIHEMIGILTYIKNQS